MHFKSILSRGHLVIDRYVHTSIYNSLIKALQLALLKDRSDSIELFVHSVAEKAYTLQVGASRSSALLKLYSHMGTFMRYFERLDRVPRSPQQPERSSDSLPSHDSRVSAPSNSLLKPPSILGTTCP